MHYRKPCGSVLEAIGNTPLVQLRRPLLSRRLLHGVVSVAAVARRRAASPLLVDPHAENRR